jgi:hypothetical protein
MRFSLADPLLICTTTDLFGKKNTLKKQKKEKKSRTKAYSNGKSISNSVGKTGDLKSVLGPRK